MTVLAAVSGGADSVALLRGLINTRLPGPGRIVSAHFNHRLRGAESDVDEGFVRELSRDLEIECVIARSPSSQGLFSEQAAREARYAFLRESAGRTGARYVVTAHTADDQAETILHRVLRGTGVGGLAGIPRSRQLMPGVALLRPLLEQRRETVLAYLENLRQDYRVDSSNQNPAYTRNRIRHELLPLATGVHGDVVPALVRLGRQADELQRYLEAQAARLADDCAIEITDRRMTLDCRPLGDAPRLLVRQLLVQLWRRQAWPLGSMGFVQWDQLAGLVLDPLAAGEPAQVTLPGGVIGRRERNQLTLLAPMAPSLS